MINIRILASVFMLLFLATGINAFTQRIGVVSFNYWQTGHVFETGSGPREDSRWVSFSQPFSRTPKVFVAIKLLDSSKDANLRIDTNARDITRYGFRLKVNTWADTKIYAVSTSWLAYTS